MNVRLESRPRTDPLPRCARHNQGIVAVTAVCPAHRANQSLTQCKHATVHDFPAMCCSAFGLLKFELRLTVCTSVSPQTGSRMHIGAGEGKKKPLFWLIWLCPSVVPSPSCWPCFYQFSFRNLCRTELSQIPQKYHIEI